MIQSKKKLVPWDWSRKPSSQIIEKFIKRFPRSGWTDAQPKNIYNVPSVIDCAVIKNNETQILEECHHPQFIIHVIQITIVLHPNMGILITILGELCMT
jgi:hypothetical protein